MRSQGNAVNSSISLPQSLPVPEIDFFTILGNLSNVFVPV